MNRSKSVKDPYGWGSSTIVNILKKREYLGPVSYTHLDVYKRQDLESLPVPDPVQIEDFKAEAEEEIQLKLDV